MSLGAPISRIPWWMRGISTARRWLLFNAVGAAGMAIQLGSLAALVHVLHVPVIPATLLAVEAALLHNFFCHERWTWRDRPAGSTAGRLGRLARFQALNGGISLGGNVIITATLSRTGGLDPVAANLVAILTCSVINYVVGDLVVFRRPAAVFIPLLVLAGTVSIRAEQAAQAIDGWTRYTAAVDARHSAAGGGSPFFALDVVRASAWRDRARAGEVPMKEVPPPGLPNGKLHHWTGAVYVPATTVDQVVRRMQDHAGRESEFYEEVKASRLLDRSGDRLRVFMRLYRDAGPVTATYNTEHAVEYRRVTPTRWTSRSVATKIAELADAGTPREREQRPGQDSGFLWRLNAYWRFEQVGDGVLVECESVSLSRSVPFLIRPIANPIVDRIARESLDRTLRSLKAFLLRGEGG